MTIERVDPNGDYCPENCRWTTMKEQHLNTRKITPIKIIETDKIFPSIAACARFLGGSSGNISRCISGKIKSYKGLHFTKLTREDAERALKERESNDE